MYWTNSLPLEAQDGSVKLSYYQIMRTWFRSSNETGGNLDPSRTDLLLTVANAKFVQDSKRDKLIFS